MIKNTTLTPHRSLYIPDHSQFALGIMGKYQTSTDNYLGMLGLTFRDNVGTEALDAAPIYQYLIQLRLQILQLQHVNNRFMGSRSATLQMLEHKLNTNIELQQINQLLSQQEISYSNPFTHNQSISNQLIDRRLQASKQLSTPAYGRSIHTIQHVTMQRNFRLADTRLPLREREGIHTATANNVTLNLKPIYLSNHQNQQWNPLLEKTLHIDTRILTNTTSSDQTRTVAFIKSLIQIDPIPPSANQTWNLAKPTIEFRRNPIKLFDTKQINSRVELTSSDRLFPIEKNLIISSNLLIQHANVNNKATLNSNFFKDTTINNKLANNYLTHYHSLFGSSFVQYIASKLSNTEVQTQQKTAYNVYLVDRSLAQHAVALTNQYRNDTLNLLLDNPNSTIETNLINNLQTEQSIYNHFFKKVQSSSAFNQSIITKQAYSENKTYETNENNLNNVSNQINEVDNKLSISSNLQLTIRNQSTNIDAARNEQLNEQNILNLFYKRVHESTKFVQTILTKLAYSQQDNNSYSRTTEVNDNRVSRLTHLQATVLNSSFHDVSATNEIPQSLLQNKPIILRNFIIKNNLYNKESSLSSLHFANTLMQKINDSTTDSHAEYNSKLILIDRNQIVSETINAINNKASDVYLKPNFLYTDVHSKVYQQFRINYLQSKQVFKALQYPYSLVQLENRLFTSRIVQEHWNEQNRIMQLNPISSTEHELAAYSTEMINVNSLSSWLQLNPLSAEQQSVLNHNYVDNIQHDLTNSIYNSLNSLQLIERNYSTENQISNNPAFVNSTFLQQINQQRNERKFQSYKTSLSPNVYQKFALSKNHSLLQEMTIKRALSDSHSNTFVTPINNINLVEKVVQTHINDWAAQIQSISLTSVNYLLNQVTNEAKISFNEINSHSVQNNNQALTLVERKTTVNNELQTQTLEQDRISILQQSKEIIQKAIFLKLRARELQEINHNVSINITSTNPNYASVVSSSRQILRETKIGTGLNQALIQQLWLNNKIAHQTTTTARSANYNYQNPPILVNQIIQDRIGDLAQIIQLKSTQVTNRLLDQAYSKTNTLITTPELAAGSNSQIIFDNTYSLKLVDRMLIDRGIINNTPIIKSRQSIQHHTDLHSLVQQFQTAPTHLKLALQHLNTYSDIQSAENTYQQIHSGSVLSIGTSLSPLIYKKYALQLLENRLSIKPLKQSLISMVTHNTSAPLESIIETIKSINLTERIVQERIHALSTLILQMPIAPANLLLHQLNLDIYRKAELEKQMEYTNQQGRLELVDRKVIERGEILTQASEMLERVNDQIRTTESSLRTTVLATIERSLVQNTEKLFSQERMLSRNLTENIRSKVTNESYVTGILSNSLKLVINETHLINDHQHALTDKIIRERIGEVTSVLQLNSEHHENQLFHANDPIMTINHLLEKNTQLFKDKSSLKLIDRKLIDRGLQAAAVVAVIQNQAAKQQTALFQALAKGTNEVQIRSIATGQITHELQQVIQHFKAQNSESHSSSGPVISYLSSLSPHIYQKFSYRNHSTKLLAAQQVKRLALTTLYNTNLPANNIQLITPSITIQRDAAEQTESVPLIYHENLTEKIVRERINERTLSAQLMTLTNEKQISTQAQLQVITQAQQELEQQIIAIESTAEDADSTQTRARPHLVLVDRNYTDQSILHNNLETLVRSTIQNRTKPEILIDRNNQSIIQFRSREATLNPAFKSAVTNVLFREPLTKKDINAQINEILTQNDHSVSMQSLQRNQINQQFIEKVTTQLLVANERNQNTVREIHNENNESFERSLTTNTESYLVNRRMNNETTETSEEYAALMAQTETTLEYLKTKAAPAEPIQQSVAKVINQQEQMVSGSDQAGKVTPITKLEFDKIVDRVYKELQKRFTYERQRRGM